MISHVSTASQKDHESLLPSGTLRVFALITGLFFLWGIPNNLNDVLIRQFMKSFVLSRFQAGLVQSTFYLGYFLLALPAGLLMRRKGYKSGFLTGLLLFSAGCFLFWPAAQSGRYGAFLLALFVVASGLAFLETAANPFIAQLGPANSSEARLSLSQAFNPVGAIFGVLVGTRFIFSGVELTPGQIANLQAAGTYTQYLRAETLRVVSPYLALGGLALLWAILIAATRFPALIEGREHQTEVGANWRALLHQKHFLFALGAQFMYVGAQVGTWSYFVQYAQQYGHVRERTAGLLLTGTLGAFGVGRFVSSYLMRRLVPSRLMGWYAAVNLLLLIVGITMTGWMGLGAIFFTSFFMSIMFPTIFALGLKDVGPNANLGGSLIVMTIIGGAVVTPMMGLVAEKANSTALSYLLPFLGYVVVGIFSLYMCRRDQDDSVIEMLPSESTQQYTFASPEKL
jgi:MFS transporter, FHS family, L-fucose permease